MAKFKKFLNSINYDGPIAASTDNTKFEEKLYYSASLDSILGSTLSLHETLVTSYNEIDTIIKKIQANNTIAKYVCASVEIKAQKCIIQINSETKFEFNDELYAIKLYCPCLNVNFWQYFFGFGHILEISKLPNSILYHADVLNLDKQDDSAAYQLFSYEFFYEVSQTLNSDSKNKGLLITYLLLVTLREYYNSVPFLLWMHGSKACEHFFGMAQQHLLAFTYADLLYLIPKIRHITNAYYNSTIINPNSKNKTSRVEYLTIEEHSTIEKNLTIEENSTIELQDIEKILTEIAKIIGNIASLNLQDDIDEDLIDAHEQIKNLSNNIYQQQIYNDNFNILDNNKNIIFDSLYLYQKYHKAYTSKRIIRSQFQETKDYNLSKINPSIASKIVAQITNNNNNSRLPKARLEQWDIRKRFENVNNKILKNLQELQLPNYSTSTRNNYSYTEEPISNINLIIFVSTKVFKNLHNLFYTKCNKRYDYFCHLSFKQILYYLGYQVEGLCANMYSLQFNAYQIYQTLTNDSILDCILCCLNQKEQK
ncbi:hypothetical protein C2G38_2164226 [Gigaspora rosea]|uniref:Uncharacterized protein n=1 Tax=Gigaspora rosea TaxID=44941 RepID=A0A397VVY2_9GLOM|nr:hypothetical protein C2G38_2164226 [Gigaspora rosea]